MTRLLTALTLASLVLMQSFPALASGTSTPPPSVGIPGSQPIQFQFESTKARVVSVDAEKGIVVLREEKKKKPRELALRVGSKTSLKAGKEKIQLAQLAVGTLVKVVFDRDFNAVSIKIEKEKA